MTSQTEIHKATDRTLPYLLDRELEECDQPERGGSRRVAPYPCPTVTAITDALEER